jgi:hypothetical protein
VSLLVVLDRRHSFSQIRLLVVTVRIIITIITITHFSCLEARCVCRQATVKAAKILPLVGLARSKQDPINCGHGAQYTYRPPPAGAQCMYRSGKTILWLA